jgi:hypothetical protein
MIRNVVLTAVAATIAGSLSLTAQGKVETVTVYKAPTCGCCAKWVEHLRQQGFATKTNEVANLDEIKAQNRVPRQARSCHTALVGGYAIEGHVPAADIQRLLKERPAGVIGLAVPGMPIGSPGMEVQGAKVQSYNVLAFDKEGRISVFASHGR